MNFTDPIPFSCAEFSNQGYYLAIAKGNDLTIFETDSFTREQNFLFSDVITSIEWSPDDNFIMVVLGKQQEIHLRCFNSAVIEGNMEGWSGVI